MNFCDDYLFVTLGKSTSWVEVIARRGLKWAANLRSKAITPELVRWLEDNGCVEVRIYMESGNPEILCNALDKGLTIEDHLRAAHALAESSIGVSAQFIANWPGETRETVLDTMRFIDELSRINPRMNFNFGCYIPMPGTPIYEDALSEGFQAPSSTEGWARIFEHPYRFRNFTMQEMEAIESLFLLLYKSPSQSWPMRRLIKPFLQRKWRKGNFRRFAAGSILKRHIALP